MSSEQRIARLTGAAYLGLAIFGVLSFLIVRPQLLVEADSSRTLANFVDRPLLAQALIVSELMTVVAQAAAAVGFYALFRSRHPALAYAVAAFGMTNAAAILGSSAFLVVASRLAAGEAIVTDTAGAVALAFSAADASWSVGAVFFGLWLIPMGWFIIATGRMPMVLGWLLIAGGVAYIVNAVLSAAAPGFMPLLVDALTIPATIGEFWIVGYLLIFGIRRREGNRNRRVSAGP